MNTELKDMMSEIQVVLEATMKTVGGMKDGERKQVKVLAQEVSAMVGKEPKEVLAFVNHFVHKTATAYVTRGKNGGLIKGTKPVKEAKVSKKSKTEDTTANTAAA